MDCKEELPMEEIAAVAMRVSLKGTISNNGTTRHLAAKNKDGSTILEKQKECLHAAATEGRVIVQPRGTADEVIRAINNGFSPEFILNKFKELLEAKKTFVQKDGQVVESPDHSVQVRALEILLKYRVGLPVQRTEVVTPANDAAANLRAKLESSSALRRAFRETLDRLDAIEVANPNGPMRRIAGESNKFANHAPVNSY
jgi:hypothetical protein